MRDDEDAQSHSTDLQILRQPTDSDEQREDTMDCGSMSGPAFPNTPSALSTAPYSPVRVFSRLPGDD